MDMLSGASAWWWYSVPIACWIKFHIQEQGWNANDEMRRYRASQSRILKYGFLYDQNWCQNMWASPIYFGEKRSSDPTGAVAGSSVPNGVQDSVVSLITSASSSLSSATRGSSAASSLRLHQWTPHVRLTRNISFCLVHASDTHLISNIFGYVTTMINFRRVMRNSSYLLPFAQWLGLPRGIGESIIASIVFYTGSILGGITATALNRGREKQAWIEKYAMENKEDGWLWNKAVAKVADLKGKDHIYLCGASAGIFSLSGFCTMASDRPSDQLSALFLVIPEIVHTISSSSSSTSTGSGTDMITGNSSESSSAMHAVGHAAHVGGFLVGMTLGYLYRKFIDYRRRQARFRRTAVPHVGGGGGGGVNFATTASATGNRLGGGGGRGDNLAGVPNREVRVRNADGSESTVRVNTSYNTVTGRAYDFSEEDITTRARIIAEQEDDVEEEEQQQQNTAAFSRGEKQQHFSPPVQSSSATTTAQPLNCCVCLTNPRSVVFHPCRHLCCCPECAEQCGPVCPVCRGEVEFREKIFMT